MTEALFALIGFITGAYCSALVYQHTISMMKVRHYTELSDKITDAYIEGWKYCYAKTVRRSTSSSD